VSLILALIIADKIYVERNNNKYLHTSWRNKRIFLNNGKNKLLNGLE
jgi:hypothetical protein